MHNKLPDDTTQQTQGQMTQHSRGWMDNMTQQGMMDDTTQWGMDGTQVT